MRSRSSFLEALTASLALPRTGLRPSGAVLRELARLRGAGCTPWVHTFGPTVRRRFMATPFSPQVAGVKDGPTAQKLDQPVDERVNHPPGHTALRRRIAGGVLGSPQAVGGRLGVSRRPVAARAECLWGGRCKLVDSSAPVRQLAPRTQPARAPNQPGTSRTQPARSPASPRPCVRVPAPRAPAG